MGNAPNAVVAFHDEGRQYWAEARTAEKVRRVLCHKCRKFFDVLWLEVISIFNIVTRAPIRPARKGEQNPPTEEVAVKHPTIRRAAEQEARKALNRPANTDQGVMKSEGFECHRCLAAKKG